MIDQTLSLAEHPGKLEQKISALLVAYEAAMTRIAEREKILENHIQLSENFLTAQVEKINALITELRAIMTDDSIAKWQTSAQEALKLGDTQLQSLRKIKDETKNLMTESCTRFERTSNTTVKHIHEAMNNFKLDDFKQYVEKSYDRVKKTSSSAIEKITDVLHWFQWKNLTLALGLSIVAGVAIGLYIDGEWPWELHSTVVKQRTAGEALIHAWPHLSKVDQQYLGEKLQLQDKSNKK